MRASVRQIRKGADGLFKLTDEFEIEWGYEENGFEYWHKLDVTHWMELPKPPELVTVN